MKKLLLLIIGIMSSFFSAVTRGLEKVFYPALAGLSVFAFTAYASVALGNKIPIPVTEVMSGSNYQYHGRSQTDEYIVTTFPNGASCYRLTGHGSISCIK